jgi:hypothetical protein
MTRPLLNLGAIAAPSREENVARMETLVQTFNSMLQTNLQLIDDPSGGATDCVTQIRVPFSDDEAYLICEHELSHVFAETDLALTETFKEQLVEKLLTRARIPVTSPKAGPYKPALAQIVQFLWNILEDWRCCSVWGELYFGGATLLTQRWKDIAKYSKDEDAQKDIVHYLARIAAGTDTPGVPPGFQKCAPHMQKARAAVDLVDNLSCLAITARLIDDIADELLKANPPPDIDQQNNQQKAQSRLDALVGAGNGKQQPQDSKDQGAGSPDIQKIPGKRDLRADAGAMRKVRKLITADNDTPEADGKTQFQKMCEAGTTRMNERIAAAKAELGKQRAADKEQDSVRLDKASKECGIRSKAVTPVLPLVRPTPRAAAIRRYLEQIKMEIDKTNSRTGSRINVQRAIQARISNNNTIPVFQKTQEIGGLQLLLLADVSGSMYGTGIAMLDQAVADVEYACRGLRVDLTLWTFSSELYFFSKLGSLQAVPGMMMMYTHTVQALEVAIEWLKNGKGDRAVVLMTDGFPTSCRKTKSSGNATEDLRQVMKELENEGVTLSTLGIGNDRAMFEQLFGQNRFGHAATFEELPAALSSAVKAIIESHLRA